jgi:hypothetical protein
MSHARITTPPLRAVDAPYADEANAAKPRLAPAPANADALKRLTIDIPEPLHRRIKVACARRGAKMADEIRSLLEERFPEGA